MSKCVDQGCTATVVHSELQGVSISRHPYQLISPPIGQHVLLHREGLGSDCRLVQPDPPHLRLD